MLLALDEHLKTRIPGVTFGVVAFQNVQVRERDEKLWQSIEELSQRQRQTYDMDGLSEQAQIAAVRGLQKSFGFDPTRYRPSSETALRVPF